MRRPTLFRIWIGWILAAMAVGATGCYDMHDQPSFQAYEAPGISAPESAIPVQGKEAFLPGEALLNPFPRTDATVQAGKTQFEIHCAMCHGPQGQGDGPVGEKWLPRPANLREERIQRLSDADLFKRITYGWGSMPGFKKRIAPEDRWMLVNYLRDFR